jgi:hypothetical protein
VVCKTKYMTQEVLCKLVIKGQHIYVVSERVPEMYMPYMDANNEIKLYFGAFKAGDRRIEACNSPNQQRVPRLHDAFGDSMNFELGKDYWYYVYVESTVS